MYIRLNQGPGRTASAACMQVLHACRSYIQDIGSEAAGRGLPPPLHGGYYRPPGTATAWGGGHCSQPHGMSPLPLHGRRHIQLLAAPAPANSRRSLLRT